MLRTARRRSAALLVSVLLLLQACDRDNPTGPHADLSSLSAAAAPESFAYVVNSGSNTVSVIRTSDNVSTASVPVGSGPVWVAVTRDGAFAYVAHSVINHPVGVSVIRTSDNAVVATLTTGGQASGIAVTPDGDFVYVTKGNPHEVVVIRTSDNTVVTRIPFGLRLADVVMSPNGSRAYVTNGDNCCGPVARVTAIETTTHTVVGEVLLAPTNASVGAGPIAISPDGALLYVANGAGRGSILVMRAADFGAVGSVQLGLDVQDIEVSPDGDFVYAPISSCGEGAVRVIRTLDNTVVANVSLPPSRPRRVAVTPDGAFVYVTRSDGCFGVGGGHSVSVIRTSDNTLLTTFPVGTEPQGVAIGVPVPPNDVPTADAGAPYSGSEGEAVRFDGTGSTDPDGDSLRYAWDFGDGSSGSGPTPSHIYADNGSYTVTLQVTDPSAASDSAQTQATITNARPVVDAGADATIPEGESFTLSGSFTDAGTHDAPWAYAIDWGDGTSSPGSSATRGSVGASHPYPQAGRYTVTLAVTDKDGGSGADSLALSVQYPFGGFFSPVDNPEVVNRARAGQGIPVKFSLGGDRGLDLFRSGYPKFVAAPCDASDQEDAIEVTTTSPAGLSYDAATGQYTYVWSTPKALARRCGRFELGLNDGSDHFALFHFLR